MGKKRPAKKEFFVRECLWKHFGIVVLLNTLFFLAAPLQTKAADMTEIAIGQYRADTHRLTSFCRSTAQKNFIAYEEMGGTLTDVKSSYKKRDLPFCLPIPERDGYNFAGWYLEEDYQTKISYIDNMDTPYMTVYAKWTKEIDDDFNVQTYRYDALKFLMDDTEYNLCDLDYSFLDQIDIPGMPSTRELDSMEQKITSTNQCPQGICFTDEYVLITSYSADEDSLGCLYVFDKDDGTYLLTMGLKKESHLGGITFDGENVWVCHSDNNTIEKISYDYINSLVSDAPGEVVDCTEDIDAYEVNNKPSCINYYNGYLLVATQTNFWNSKLKTYRFENDELIEEANYTIPSKVQGVAIDDEGRVFLSTSLGRTKSSYLKVYSTLTDMSNSPSNPELNIEMPPCSEEVAFEDGTLYVLFESAGYKYYEGTDGNGTSTSPLEKILTINVASLLQ